jgi:hypothetical protein
MNIKNNYDNKLEGEEEEKENDDDEIGHVRVAKVAKLEVQPRRSPDRSVPVDVDVILEPQPCARQWYPAVWQRERERGREQTKKVQCVRFL